jgi:hypothetical protein
MNCIIYGTKCEYTSAWSSQGGSSKRKEGSEAPAGAPRGKKRVKTSTGGQSSGGDGVGDDTTPGHSNADEGSLSSTSPNEENFDPGQGAEGGVDSSDPVQIVGVDSSAPGLSTENTSTARGVLLTYDAEPRDVNAVLVHDQLGKKLVHYLTPMMTGVDNDEDIALSAEDAGLPPEAIAEACVQGELEMASPAFEFY